MRHSSAPTFSRLRTVRSAGISVALAAALLGGTATAATAAATPVIAAAAPVSAERPTAPLSLPRANTTLPTSATVDAPTPVVRAAPTWVIHIDTVGHQDELDQCLWVRMDFTATAPIVGMHNFCGGDFVLDMVWGQTVQLVGQGLDGTYLVTTDRRAFAGDSPSGVTAGMVATVFLQTCYWDREQGMRLVALTLLPEVPRVIAGAS